MNEDLLLNVKKIFSFLYIEKIYIYTIHALQPIRVHGHCKKTHSLKMGLVS